ncbi:MAG: alkaline phosphatase family protein [Anaerolineae bacterium]|nr:alkaline phosphatase family protein [Anaerolineae bacterium]
MGKKLVIIGIDGAADSITTRLLHMGKLPHLQKLIDEGCYATATPFWPGETGANWATISTGASPAVHGCAYNIHLPGTPLDELTSGFPSTVIQAEQIWQTAARFGRQSVIFNYPQSYPVNSDRVIHVGGDGQPDPDHNEIFANQGYTTRTPPAYTAFGNPVMTQLQVGPAQEWAHLPERPALATELELRPTWKAAARIRPTALHLLIHPAEGGLPAEVVLCTAKDGRTALGRAREGEWSGWMATRLATEAGEVEVVFRMKVISLSPDGRDLHLYLTPGTRPASYTTPAELALELNRHCGHYRRRLVTQQWVVPNACDRRTFLEEAVYQANWYAEAARYVFERHDWDLFIMKWHGPDILQHHSMHLIDPVHPLHDPARAEEGWQLFADLYGAGDRMAGRIAEAAGPDAIVCVVSDHGGFAIVFQVQRIVLDELERAGWIVRNADRSVDWAKTRLFPTGEAIWINLKGRDPQGCVEPQDYERVRAEAIEFLRGLRHPVTEEHLFSLVCSKEDAAFMGYGGERAGDILFCDTMLGVARPLSPADLAELPESRHMLGLVTGSHGLCLPSTRFSEGSNEGIFVLKGPGVRRSGRRAQPISLADVAPTLCHLWGIPAPAQAEGRVVREFLL